MKTSIKLHPENKTGDFLKGYNYAARMMPLNENWSEEMKAGWSHYEISRR